MVRVSPGDLVAIHAEGGRYYYALVLDKVGLFGGNWSFAFHETSGSLLSPEDVFSSEGGFHAFIDFIFAKREKRITRLATKVDVGRYDGVKLLRGRNVLPGRWQFIYDRGFEEVARVERLSDEEKGYPFFERIDDTIMMQRVDRKWTPAADD